jgi:hypothetical protein
MNRLTAGLAIAALTLSACATTPTITSDTTPGASFATYKTFAWVNTLPPPGMSPVAYERVRQGVAANLLARGYTEGDPADLTLIVTLGAKEKLNVSSFGGRWGGPWGGGQLDVRQSTKGSMYVDAFDTRTRRPVWHGQASQDIDPDKVDPQALDRAVSQVMAKFPPRA